MELSKKLYQLRKQQGLSQEQLAERLNVSRQAISKWESGTAIPETDKLLAISNYFQVSLDYLVKDGEDAGDSTAMTDSANATEPTTVTPPAAPVKTTLPGMILCIAGVLLLCVWGLLTMLRPETSAQLGESSMITIDGNGIFLLLCVTAIIAGAWLLLKGRPSK